MALQSTLVATLLGAPYVAGALPGAQLPPLEDVLHDAVPPTPSLRAQVARGRGTPFLQSSRRVKTKQKKRFNPSVCVCVCGNPVSKGLQFVHSVRWKHSHNIHSDMRFMSDGRGTRDVWLGLVQRSSNHTSGYGRQRTCSLLVTSCMYLRCTLVILDNCSTFVMMLFGYGMGPSREPLPCSQCLRL